MARQIGIGGTAIGTEKGAYRIDGTIDTGTVSKMPLKGG